MCFTHDLGYLLAKKITGYKIQGRLHGLVLDKNGRRQHR